MARKGLWNMASIFIGPGGLRAGWRFLLFVLGIELAEFYLREPLLSCFPVGPVSTSTSSLRQLFSSKNLVGGLARAAAGGWLRPAAGAGL